MNPEYVLYNDLPALVLKKYKNDHGEDTLYDIFVFSNPSQVLYGVSDSSFNKEVEKPKPSVSGKVS